MRKYVRVDASRAMLLQRTTTSLGRATAKAVSYVRSQAAVLWLLFCPRLPSSPRTQLTAHFRFRYFAMKCSLIHVERWHSNPRLLPLMMSPATRPQPPSSYQQLASFRQPFRPVPYTPHLSALRSSGTLLPLPARYFLGLPRNSLGFGNTPSSTHFHRGSSMWIFSPLGRPPPPPLVFVELVRVGLGLLAAPFGVRVKELTSSMERSPETDPEWARALGGGGGAAERGDDGAPDGGGGGGGAELGECEPPAAAAAAAPITAWTAMLGAAADGGGGGNGDRAGAGGGRGAEVGGGGGGAGGKDGAAEDGGGGAGAPGNGGAEAGAAGFRPLGSGGGFFPIGGGGGFIEPLDPGRGASDLLRFAIDGCAGRAGTARPGMAGAAPGGGRGAEATGGFGADIRDDSGSDR